MIDIKSLFLTAKNSGAENDVKAYIEAVNNVINTSPRDYVLQLEYIIQSSAGINTLIPFIEKWGMPIALYDTIYEKVLECINEAKSKKINVSGYTEAKEYLEEFRKKNIHGFVMYEFYRPEDVSDYIKTYYGFTKKHQNRYLGAGMIQKFGEYVIPDILITTESIGLNKAVNAFHEYVRQMDRTPLLNEFLKECYAEHNLAHSVIMNESASTIINSMHKEHQEVFREAMIMEEEEWEYEYTQEQLEAIQDLISYNEYMLTWCDEIPMDTSAIQAQIYDLYNESETIEEDHSKDKKHLKDSDYIPIYAVLQSFQHSKTDNYGNPKDDKLKGMSNANETIRFMSGGDKFSHALISLDSDFQDIYSFGASGFERSPIEEWRFWTSTDEIYVSVSFLTKEEFESVKKFINSLQNEKEQTSYAYANVIKMFVGNTTKNRKRNVCSGFVASVLQYANPKLLHRDYSRMRPEDITLIPRSFYVMSFKDRDDFLAKKAEFKARVKAIKEEHIDEIKEYNNDLPKIMLKEQMDKLSFFDKIIDWFMDHDNKKKFQERVD